LEANEKSGSKKKGCRTKAGSQSTSLSKPESSQKQPSVAIISSQCPVCRDSAKKMKTTEFVVDKVTQGIANAIAPHTSKSVNNPVMKSLEEGL